MTAELTAELGKALGSDGQNYKQSVPKIADEVDDGFRLRRVIWLGVDDIIDITSFWFYTDEAAWRNSKVYPQRSILTFTFFDAGHPDFKNYDPILGRLQWANTE